MAPIHLANAARSQQATTKVAPTASGRTKGESQEKRAHQVKENIYLLTKTTIMVAFISYGENLVPLPSADLRRQSPRSSAVTLQASRNQVAIRRGLMRAASRSGVEVAYEHDRQGGIAWHLQEFVSLGDLHARTDLLQMRRHEAEGMA